MTSDPNSAELVRRVAARRLRVALILTAVLLAIYFAFMMLVAFAKRLLAVQLAPGLSLAIVLAVLVILSGWALAIIYVWWANTRHDAACERLGQGLR